MNRVKASIGLVLGSGVAITLITMTVFADRFTDVQREVRSIYGRYAAMTTGEGHMSVEMTVKSYPRDSAQFQPSEATCRMDVDRGLVRMESNRMIALRDSGLQAMILPERREVRLFNVAQAGGGGNAMTAGMRDSMLLRASVVSVDERTDEKGRVVRTVRVEPSQADAGWLHIRSALLEYSPGDSSLHYVRLDYADPHPVAAVEVHYRSVRGSIPDDGRPASVASLLLRDDNHLRAPYTDYHLIDYRREIPSPISDPSER